jgi:hypothetical protein
VRSAAARERVQDRPLGLGIVVRPAAGSPGGLAAVGELQPEPEGAPGRGQVTQPAGQVLPGMAGTGPDPRGYEDLDPGGEADSPVTAAATWSVRPSSGVSTGTMPQ